MYESRKENVEDFRKGMYESFKNNGILDSLKAQARSKIFSELKKRNSAGRPGEDYTSIKSKLEGKNNNLVYKLCISLINDFLKKSELAFTMSVLIPESGLGSQTLTKPELEEVLKLRADSQDEDDESAPISKANIPLLQEIVESIKKGQSIRPNQVTCSVQTDEGEEGLTLDQKLKRLDQKYMEASVSERVMPYKVLEERMLKYKRECDERVAKEIQSQVARIREIEISHVRLEEGAAYRSKLAEFRNELDSMHKDKIKELKLREAEIIERCKIKEREIEAAAFEHRQKVLKDLEMLRFKEQENKKTVEMELLVIKNERDKLFQKEKEADLKLKDLHLLKVALEKKVQTEIEEFRRKYEGERDDEKRDLQIRRMQLEEDEHRFTMNRDKFLLSEKDKTQLEKENFTLKEKLEKLTSDHEKCAEIKEQLKAFTQNSLRDYEIINSKKAQAETYENEAKTLRELLDAQKSQMKNEKETNQEIIDNLRQQLKEQKDMLSRTADKYDNEIERLVSEAERQKDNYKNMHRAEEYKLKTEIENLNKKMDCESHLTKELTIINDKLMKDKSYNRNQYDIEGLQRDTYFRGDTANVGVRQTDFLTANGIPIISNIVDPQLGQEYLERQKAWNDLDRDSRDVKRNISQIGLMPIAERIYQPHYDLEKEVSQSEDDQESDHIDYKPPSKVRQPSPTPAKEPEKKPERKSPPKSGVAALRAQVEEADKRREEADRKKRDEERENRRLEALEKDRQDRLKREEERKERERKKLEEKKSTPSPAPAKNISSNIKNPFAKMTPGGKKLDPVQPPKAQFKKQESNGGGITDNYDFGFDDKPKKSDPKDDDIGEEISEHYSGFDDDDQNDEFFF